MIRQAFDYEYDKIIQIWEDAFHDEKEYISFFLSQHPCYTCLVYETKQRIAAMLFLIPCSLARQSGYYVYACATSPEYQRKGYMRQLLEFSFRKAQQEKAFGLILVPGSNSLFKYYEKIGYQKFSGLGRTIFYSRRTERFLFQSYHDSQLILQIRNKFFDVKTSVHFGESHIQYIMKQVEKSSGAVLLFSQNEKTGYALCLEDALSKELHVMEWALLSDNLEKDAYPFFEGICHYFDKMQLFIRSQAKLNMGMTWPFSMIRRCKDVVFPDYRLSYFNLGMDT
ncbi:MAG: GNAT family N-acetyltransferase [Bacteroidales bacterium]|jgi:predicted acetyltransferase|nr:GNAT family N-acetyltransferase [Bacteroidales bacterium]